MKTTAFLCIAAALMLGACGGPTDEQIDFEQLRAAGAGKSDGWFDPNLSCQGSCGGLATGLVGYCGCDAKCASLGDCCHDKAQVCDNTTGPDPLKCQQIESSYAQAVTAAGTCNADADCSKFVSGNLACHLGHDAIDPLLSGPVDAAKQQWTDNKCSQYPWVCPAIAPLPPWMQPKGLCEQGQCRVEYIDTRAKEGEGCGSDINVQCGDGLYCAFGLNWCGTPPVVGVCRAHGDCGAPSDCDNVDNLWARPRCVGEATCDSNNKCGWNCGPIAPTH